MKIHYPKLRNMNNALSLSVFIAFKGTNKYIFYFVQLLQMSLFNMYVLI